MASSSGTTSSKKMIEGTTNKNKGIAEEEDQVKVLVAFDGKWEWGGKEWLFKNSKGSIMVVPKNVTLSQITGTLCRNFDVNQHSHGLKLEVNYRAGSPWFPIIEIQSDEDLSVFISESWKSKLPLCVTATVLQLKKRINPDIEEESASYRKDLIKAIQEGNWVNAQKIVTAKQFTWTSKLNDAGNTALHFVVGRYKDNYAVTEILSHVRETPLLLDMGIHKDQVVVTDILNDVSDSPLYDAIKLLLNTVTIDGLNPAHTAAYFGNTEALRMLVGLTPKCLFIPDYNRLLAIDYALMIPGTTETFLYLFKQMKDSTNEFGAFLSKYGYGTKLLGQVIDTGLIDVAYELINDCPSLATTMYEDKTVLECIIRKPELFYSGTSYSLYSRFVYHNVLFENNNFGSTNTPDVEKPEVPIENNNFGTTNTEDVENPEIEEVLNENNNLGNTNTPDVENQVVPFKNTADVENPKTIKKDIFLTMDRLLHEVNLWIIVKLLKTILLHVNSWTIVKLLKTTLLHVPHGKHLKDDKVKHNTTIKLLRRICEEVGKTYELSDSIYGQLAPFFLAVENNITEAIDVLTTFFPRLYDSGQGGQNIYQSAVLNRSEKVYRYLLHQGAYTKSGFLTSIDGDGNNILHLAGRLAPPHKLNANSGAALQLQRELQWFEEVKRVVGITHTRARNKNKETPMMVFRREHKQLRKDGEEWMKKTADSYTITAALIITIVFAAAITVPGGNDDKTGKPMYQTKSSLIIFAISDAISLFTSTTSLLLFLSILTARYADEDFLYKLPKRLIFGLVMLFVSVTSMMIAFSAALYIMFGQEKQMILITIAALACLPITSFMTLQFELLQELISSTYGHRYFGMEKDYRQSSANANKKKMA